MAFPGRTVLALMALIPAVAGAQAAKAPPALVMTAENLQAGDQRHRDIAAQHGDPSAVMPGDTVRYRLTFTNDRADSVRNVQFNDPLPKGLRYVGGSAKADRNDVTVEFSIDGGKTWSAQPMIETVVDGEKVSRPAPSSMYTHVRWIVRGWVKPRATVTAEFNANLTAGAIKP